MVTKEDNVKGKARYLRGLSVHFSNFKLATSTLNNLYLAFTIIATSHKHYNFQLLQKIELTRARCYKTF